jgi:hypothetical protein
VPRLCRVVLAWPNAAIATNMNATGYKGATKRSTSSALNRPGAAT